MMFEISFRRNAENAGGNNNVLNKCDATRSARVGWSRFFSVKVVGVTSSVGCVV